MKVSEEWTESFNHAINPMGTVNPVNPFSAHATCTSCFSHFIPIITFNILWRLKHSEAQNIHTKVGRSLTSQVLSDKRKKTANRRRWAAPSLHHSTVVGFYPLVLPLFCCCSFTLSTCSQVTAYSQCVKTVHIKSI